MSIQDFVKNPVFKIIGVGDIGCTVVDYLTENKMEYAEFLKINNNTEIKKEVTDFLANTDLCLVVADGGFSFSTIALPVIISLARKIDVHTILITPNRYSFDQEYGFDSSLMINCNKILNKNMDKLSFSKPIQAISRAVKDFVYNYHAGIICVDLNDIYKIFGANNYGIIGIGQSVGNNRAVIAAEQALDTILSANVSIAQAKDILVCISCGLDFKMEEMENIKNILSNGKEDNYSAYTNVILNPDMQNTIRVTLYITFLQSHFV